MLIPEFGALLPKNSNGARFISILWAYHTVTLCVCVLDRWFTWMSQEVSKRLGSVGYNPNIPVGEITH